MRYYFVLALLFTLVSCDDADNTTTQETTQPNTSNEEPMQLPASLLEQEAPVGKTTLSQEELSKLALETLTTFKTALNNKDFKLLSGITSFPFTFECDAYGAKGREVGVEGDWATEFSKLFTQKVITELNTQDLETVFKYSKFTSTWRRQGMLLTLRFPSENGNGNYTYEYWFEFNNNTNKFLLSHTYCNIFQ